jgi:hypothetical protein
VSDEDTRAVLQGDDALRGRDVFLERRQWFLDDGYVEAVFDKNVVNASPAGTIGPGPVDENNIPNAMFIVLRAERAGR